jgi:hypothetical protein
MPDAVHVLVIFGSPSELTEQLALAAAVGAVQERASIRIRRLSTSEEDLLFEHDALIRMQREYVSPTSADTLWADAVIIGMHNKLSGMPMEPDAATNYGRGIAAAIRAFKTGRV